MSPEVTGSGSKEQRGPVYDRGLRTLARLDPELLVRAVGVTPEGKVQSLEATFPGATLVPDGLFRVGPHRLAHVEYTRRASPELLARMLVYRGLIMQRHPRHQIDQHVIVLGDGRLKGFDDLPAYGWALELKVSYLREMAPEVFLASRVLSPLAVLARGDRRARVLSLVRALALIGPPEADAGSGVSAMLMEVAVNLASIRLDGHTIIEAMKESGMSSESITEFYGNTPVVQDLVKQGREQGREASLARVLGIVIRGKFGERPEADLVSRRLAHLDEAEALRMVESAAVFADLLTSRA